MKNYKNDKCRICASKELEEVLFLNPSPLADNYVSKSQLSDKQELFDMNVSLCKQCGLVQLLTVV